MPPFGGIKPVCHDRHKTVPEFIVILLDFRKLRSLEILNFHPYFNSVAVVVIGLNALITYQLVLQIYTLLTFKCIAI